MQLYLLILFVNVHTTQLIYEYKMSILSMSKYQVLSNKEVMFIFLLSITGNCLGIYDNAVFCIAQIVITLISDLLQLENTSISET